MTDIAVETAPEITDTETSELANPKIRAVATRVARQIELAIEKVAANASEPQQFPLASDENSIEQILAARFSTLRPRTQQAAAARALDRINVPADVRARRFGDLATVDLRKPLAIERQVEGLPFPAELKFPASELRPDDDLSLQVAPPSSTEVSGLMNKVELRIHRVTCLDETDGFFGSEAGSDEIDLGGTAVDATGATKKIGAFRVGLFNDNDKVTYSPPRNFTTFSLTVGTEFPKTYFVTLVLAETDMGGLPEFLDELLGFVKQAVVAALTTSVGGVLGTSGGPVGAAIGAAVGLVVGLVFLLFKSIWEDDIFGVAPVSVKIPHRHARWPGKKTNSPNRTITYAGHGGRYQLVYDWRVFA